MNENYLKILQDGLKKKSNLLDEILVISKKQAELLEQDSLPLEEFDQCVDNKDVCLEQLEQLDDGFEVLYSNVKNELESHKEQYKDWIRTTQGLIREVMDKSVAIQTLEQRNKQKIEQSFKRERKGLNKGKRSVSAAMNYYRNMSNTGVNTSRYMDEKH